jgi:predicted DNA-binding antitoxin AbrB/MazE fold protein
VYDSETGDWDIDNIGNPVSLKEGKKVRRVITESDNKELQDLLIMQKAIEERIKYLSS